MSSSGELGRLVLICSKGIIVLKFKIRMQMTRCMQLEKHFFKFLFQVLLCVLIGLLTFSSCIDSKDTKAKIPVKVTSTDQVNIKGQDKLRGFFQQNLEKSYELNEVTSNTRDSDSRIPRFRP